MNSITRFFWFCSGANFAILKRTPTESNKYVGIGATVFFTGVLAALAAGYALFSVFQKPIILSCANDADMFNNINSIE